MQPRVIAHQREGCHDCRTTGRRQYPVFWPVLELCQTETPGQQLHGQEDAARREDGQDREGTRQGVTPPRAFPAVVIRAPLELLPDMTAGEEHADAVVSLARGQEKDRNRVEQQQRPEILDLEPGGENGSG